MMFNDVEGFNKASMRHTETQEKMSLPGKEGQCFNYHNENAHTLMQYRIRYFDRKKATKFIR